MSRHRRRLAAAACAFVVGAGLWLTIRPGERPVRPAVVAATPTPAPAPAGAFLATECAATPLAAGSHLGLGIPRPARLVAGSTERAVLDGAVRCLRTITSQPPTLRTQVPIDAARRATDGDDERAELVAFAALLREYGAPGLLSIRAHDFTRCGRAGAPPATQVDRLAASTPLRRCQFPTPRLYADLLAELVALAGEVAPGADLHWTAWNEPDHPMFTLLDGLGSLGAARRAGQYWQRAVEQLGAERVLAGEFSDRDARMLLRLRRAFEDGAEQRPAAWALHPYRDLTRPEAGGSVDERFARAVAPAPVWMTEVTVRLSGRGGLGGDAAAQGERGLWLREEVGRRPVRALLYLLTPPDAPRVAAGDSWDSAIADRQGRARPFVCGLAGLPPEQCSGDPAPFGG